MSVLNFKPSPKPLPDERLGHLVCIVYQTNLAIMNKILDYATGPATCLRGQHAARAAQAVELRDKVRNAAKEIRAMLVVRSQAF